MREVFAFPASFAQRRLWFLEQLDPGGTAYGMQALFHVRGPIDPAVLEWTLNQIVARHESLRTTFGLEGGEPLQLIAPALTIALRIVDPPRPMAEAKRIAHEEATQPFDLARGPLLRALLIKIDELDAEEHLLALALHHIIADGWSLAVLVEEASQLYERRAPLPELPIQYADYSAWQHEQPIEDQLAYWRARLAGAPAALELPIDHPRRVLRKRRGAQHALEVPRASAESLRALCRREGATLYMGLLAAFQALLHRYTGQEELSVGTPIAGRTRRETEPLIGFFVNTLVMRGDLSGAPGFLELLARVKETTLGAYAHQDLAFEKLVEALAPERDLFRTPLFQVMFVLHTTPPPRLRLGRAEVTALETGSAGAKFDLTLALEERAGGAIGGHLEYDADLFEPATIARLADHFLRLLAAMLAEPHRPIAALPLESERFAQPIKPSRAACLHPLFEEHARRRPEAIAVGRWTRRELDARADRLARSLRARGIGPESRVAILAEPSPEMVLGLLAVLKAGGAYVPIDPAFPAERVRAIVEQSGARLVLTEGVPALRAEVELVRLEDFAEGPVPCDDAELPNLATPANAAYVIYTSGSTGRPKGVVVEHRQLVSYLDAIVERFGLEEGMRYAMVQPLAVDACNTVLLPALFAGGTLHVFPRARAADPFAIAEDFAREPIDVLKIAPSHFAAWLEASPSPALMPRRVLALGGEGSPSAWLERDVVPRAHPGSQSFIHYGPTETTVGVLTHRLDQSDARTVLAPLGSPLANAQVYVLNAAMQPVPIGVAGELFVGGACVARGYLAEPARTAERFLPDPFSTQAGARLYRTGDLGRRRADGTIEFLGRTDHQIKIRGFRVELGELEAALCAHPDVERAIAIARDAGHGEKRLFAYVTSKRAAADRDSFACALEAGLRQRLPAYMMPAAIVVLERMPLSAQGKVDLGALPVPAAGSAPARVMTPPRDATEAGVAQIWQELLAREPGVHDDFFQLGGHSLLAVRMLAAVKKRFGRGVPVASFLPSPTIASLAAQLSRSGAAPIVVALKPTGSATPIFCVHNAISYVELAAALEHEQPLFALDAPEAGIEDLATLYLRELRKVRPRGPYAIAGWSRGGSIAFELVRRLEAEGEEIELLALFDAHPPEHGTIAQPIELFVAEDGEGLGVLDRAWSEHTRGGVHLSVVHGDHHSMLHRPHVERIASRLAERRIHGRE